MLTKYLSSNYKSGGYLCTCKKCQHRFKRLTNIHRSIRRRQKQQLRKELNIEQ